MDHTELLLVWMAFLARENALQAEIIRLQKQLEEYRPHKPGEDAHWHHISGGVTAEETLRSNDLEAIRALKEWTLVFAEKYLKPYLHHEVYMETLAHLNRGISATLARLEVEADLGSPPSPTQHKLLDFFSAFSSDAESDSHVTKPSETTSFDDIEF